MSSHSPDPYYINYDKTLDMYEKVLNEYTNFVEETAKKFIKIEPELLKMYNHYKGIINKVLTPGNYSNPTNLKSPELINLINDQLTYFKSEIIDTKTVIPLPTELEYLNPKKHRYNIYENEELISLTKRRIESLESVQKLPGKDNETAYKRIFDRKYDLIKKYEKLEERTKNINSVIKFYLDILQDRKYPDPDQYASPPFFEKGYTQYDYENAIGSYGGGTKVKYNGKTYKVRVGKRGGKYILVGSEKKKVYV